MWCRMILLVVLPVIRIGLDGGRAPQVSQSMIQGNSRRGRGGGRAGEGQSACRRRRRPPCRGRPGTGCGGRLRARASPWGLRNEGKGQGRWRVLSELMQRRARVPGTVHRFSRRSDRLRVPRPLGGRNGAHLGSPVRMGAATAATGPGSWVGAGRDRTAASGDGARAPARCRVHGLMGADGWYLPLPQGGGGAQTENRCQGELLGDAATWCGGRGHTMPCATTRPARPGAGLSRPGPGFVRRSGPACPGGGLNRRRRAAR